MKENLDTLDKIMRDGKLRNFNFIPSANFQKHLSFIPPENHYISVINNGSMRGTFDPYPNNEDSILIDHYNDENFRGESFEDNEDMLPASMGNNMRYFQQTSERNKRKEGARRTEGARARSFSSKSQRRNAKI